MPFEMRWAFNASAWLPCKQQIQTALSGISREEIDRIQRFRFKDDYKLSLIGRLMIRKCVQLCYGISWSSIELHRNQKGKPFCSNLRGQREPALSFNVSHQGDYTVLATSTTTSVGIDVMKFTYPNNTDVPSFFRIMNRQFVESEWEYIKSFKDDWTQLQAFYRLWCLKESYVKAIGVGIGTESAETMHFKINTFKMDLVKNCEDSVLFVNNKQAPWSFNECLLDEEHVATVAYENTSEKQSMSSSLDFQFISFEELTNDLEIVTSPKTDWWTNFTEKSCKN